MTPHATDGLDVRRATLVEPPERLRRAAAALTLAGSLTGCVELEQVTCALRHIPDGYYGTVGEELVVDWGTMPVENVRFNRWSGHTRGDGETALLEVRENGFLLVALHDAMILEGNPQRPKRWTKADHYELVMNEDGTGTLYNWLERAGRVPSREAEQARAGNYTPVPKREGQTLVWRCKESW